MPMFNAPSDIAVRVSSNRAYAKPKASVEERAKAWMDRHPAVYQLFCKFALEIANKLNRFSANAIVERVRWETAVQGGNDFKIANAVTTYLARRFMLEHPEHASLFLRGKKGGAA